MDIPEGIKDAIKNNKLVVFVGSGLSRRFELPDWNQLAKDVIISLNIEKYNVFLPVLDMKSMPALDIIELLKPEHGEIRKYISSNFDIKNGNLELHKKILELSGQIITTNYDNAFEKASNHTITPTVHTSTFNINEINKSNTPYIFKIHGSFTEPDNCVVFKEDYDNIYNNESATKEKLKTIFSEKTILFVGFSFSDPDINQIFEDLDRSFGNYNKHFIITNEPDKFDKFKFLKTFKIKEFIEVETFIDSCKILKAENKELPKENIVVESHTSDSIKIAYLSPNPLDKDFNQELSKIRNCFDSLDATLHHGTLNIKTLFSIEDFDVLIIASKVFKSNIYIEDDNLKSNLLSPLDICDNIPNDKIPIIFITNEKIDNVQERGIINISTFKQSIINRFVYKALKNNDLSFNDKDISVYLTSLIGKKILKGNTRYYSMYNNDKNLEIGKKCLLNVVGRVEEQANIATGLINIQKTNKLLNIKASGGTGKTTLVKKVAYELYNRGYFRDGVNFRSCESIKTFSDFEEILIGGFNLVNILNFKEYLIENYRSRKIDSLLILDNFETIVNTLNQEDYSKAITLLKFLTDYSNISITSREKLSSNDDFEEVYSLTPLITDDAFELFEKYYGRVNNEDEIRILRNDILEDLLNNNPLAIKLVTNSRTRFSHIDELKMQLKEHFFESINEDFSSVFKNNADLNIERTRSIYQSINYSYTTLSNNEKLAFELLNLFPDGISLSNFKKCFDKKESSTNNISDKELRVLRNKSLVEDYNGTLQLQPIIRRFAEFKFSKRSIEIRKKYCLDAYLFNCFILKIIELIEKDKSRSEALKLYNMYKNNLGNVLKYIPDVELSEKGPVPEKKLLLNFIYSIQDFFVTPKQINEFQSSLQNLNEYFSDLPNAELLMKALVINKEYFFKEFDISYQKLSKLLSVDEMEERNYKNEDFIEAKYKNIVSNVHSMEGYTLQRINSQINNDNDTSRYLDSHFFYLGISENIIRKKDGFYYFEYELMFNKLIISRLEEYIESLHTDEHLEIMQCTYTLSKVKRVDHQIIKKLVVTNPYTKGLKDLMNAFVASKDDDKTRHFENALSNLSHIKYYYLECLYYYCLWLKDLNSIEYGFKVKEGIEMSSKFRYQYLNFLFENIENNDNRIYDFSYSYYPTVGLEQFVRQHNAKWEEVFRKGQL